MEIIKFNSKFDFNRFTLANPEPQQTGNYFTQISIENNKPLCIQFPNLNTANGFYLLGNLFFIFFYLVGTDNHFRQGYYVLNCV